jgi:hypothetical protein
MVDKVDLFAHLYDLEQFSLLKNLHDPVNPFDIPVQEEIPEVLSVVLVEEYNGLGVDMTVNPRRDTAERIENGSHHKNDGYN